jgi:hypothetical protein
VLRYAHLEPPPAAPPAGAAGADATLGDVYAGKWWRTSAAGAAASASASTSASASAAGGSTPRGSPRASAAAAAPSAFSSSPAAPPMPTPSPPRAPHAPPLVSPEAESLLSATSEFDYLTHAVFRMYERFDVPSVDPRRFRLEVTFSRGAAVDWSTPELHAALTGSAGSGGGSFGGGSCWPNGTLPDGAYSRCLMRRTQLQNDSVCSNVPAVQAQAPAQPDGEAFLTLARAEEVLWRFMKLPPAPPAASAAAAAAAVGGGAANGSLAAQQLSGGSVASDSGSAAPSDAAPPAVNPPRPVVTALLGRLGAAEQQLASPRG